MDQKPLEVTYASNKLQKLEIGNSEYIQDYSPRNIMNLKSEYNSLLRHFENRTDLSGSDLEKYTNSELDWLIDMERAKRHQKKLGKSTTNLYALLRKFYYSVQNDFGLEIKRIIY